MWLADCGQVVFGGNYVAGGLWQATLSGSAWNYVYFEPPLGEVNHFDE